MIVSGLDHVSVSTQDLDRSLGFYTGLLGLRLMNRGEIDDSMIADMSGRTGVKVLFADIDLSRGQVLELLQTVAPNAHEHADVGRPSGHFALAVDDIEQVHRRLVAAGVVVRGKITEIDEPGHWFGAKAAYVLDPDGVTVELIQRRSDGSADPAA
ncbi:MAG: VOC family protein [Actinomycetota bacterium]|nr:VOC family protein [Actinomycetota bacterium]